MSFYFVCLSCGKKQLAADNMKGQKVACQRCGKEILVRKDSRLNRDSESQVKPGSDESRQDHIEKKVKTDSSLKPVKDSAEESPLFSLHKKQDDKAVLSTAKTEPAASARPLPALKPQEPPPLKPKKGILKPLGRKKGPV